jgi:hypothetical protein
MTEQIGTFAAAAILASHLRTQTAERPIDTKTAWEEFVTTKHTGSARLDRWIAQAESLGLVVTVEDTSIGSIQQRSVTIRRPKVVAVNALDDYNNLRGLHLVATRSSQGGRWSHTAAHTGLTYRPIPRLSTVRYAIEGLTD